MRAGCRLLGAVLIALSLTAFSPAEETKEPNRTQVMAARATPARRAALPNGMVILLKESPTHNLIAVEMLCQVGLQNEQTPQAGLIALWKEILQERLDEATAKEYRIINKTVSIEPDFLRFSIVGPSTDGKRILQICSELVANSEYDEKVVSRHRKELLDEIKGGGGARRQLYTIFRTLFYRYHPYRRQHTGGTLALERVDADVLSEFHKQYLVPNRTVLAAAGRFSRTEIEEEARALFAPLESNKIIDTSVAWEPKAVEKTIELHTSADIAWVLVGYQAPTAASEDHIPMMLIRTILSEGLSSRLFNEIRERRGLSYTISAVHPDLKGPSHFLTYVVTRPHDAGKVRRQVLKQMDIMTKELLDSGELAAAKQKLRGGFLLERETVSGTAFRLARAESIGLGYGYEENFEKNLQEVSSADLRRVARQYLVNPTVIVARPYGRLYWDG